MSSQQGGSINTKQLTVAGRSLVLNYPFIRLTYLDRLKKGFPELTGNKGSPTSSLFTLYRGSLALAIPRFFLDGQKESLQSSFAYPLGNSMKELSRYFGIFLSASFLAAVFITPFDVISSNYALDSESGNPYSSILQCAQEILKVKGVSGLFAGIEFNFALEFISFLPLFVKSFLNRDKVYKVKDDVIKDESEAPELEFSRSAMMGLMAITYPLAFYLENLKYGEMITYVDGSQVSGFDGFGRSLLLNFYRGLAWTGFIFVNIFGRRLYRKVLGINQ